MRHLTPQRASGDDRELLTQPKMGNLITSLRRGLQTPAGCTQRMRARAGTAEGRIPSTL